MQVQAVFMEHSKTHLKKIIYRSSIQLYAATKKSNELMAHAYSHIYKIPTTGLRFFTVYGVGRPDMALFKFTKNILLGKKIKIFNYGNHSRDFTYVDDIVRGIIKSMNSLPKINKKFNFKIRDFQR